MRVIPTGVFIHGFGGCAGHWDDVIARVAETLDVRVVELAGHGARHLSPNPLTISRAAREIDNEPVDLTKCQFEAQFSYDDRPSDRDEAFADVNAKQFDYLKTALRRHRRGD